MKPNDRMDFSSMMALMAEVYGKACTEPFVNIYWHLLKEWELRDIRRAFKDHLHNPDGGQFFPKPADLIRMLEGSGEGRALRAWTQVEQAIRQIGCYQSLAFDDPLIHAVIEEMGGWIQLCGITLKALPFCSAEFQKRYRAFLHKAPRRYPSYLCGLTELDNAKEGYPFDPPVLVGDPDKAKAVMATGGGSSLLIRRPQSMQELIQSVFKVQQKPEGEKNDP